MSINSEALLAVVFVSVTDFNITRCVVLMFLKIFIFWGGVPLHDIFWFVHINLYARCVRLVVNG